MNINNSDIDNFSSYYSEEQIKTLYGGFRIILEKYDRELLTENSPTRLTDDPFGIFKVTIRLLIDNVEWAIPAMANFFNEQAAQLNAYSRSDDPLDQQGDW